MDNAEQTAETMPRLASSPPTQGASQFIISATPVEFLITVGHSRVLFDQGNGGPTGQNMPEWFMTLALSPFTAKQLSAALVQALDVFEKQAGISLPTQVNSVVTSP